MALASPSSFRARRLAPLALIGYIGLLATSLLEPAGRAGVAGTGVFDLSTGSRVLAVVFAMTVYVLVETVRFLPVGALAVLSLPRPRGDRMRMLPMAAAAGAGSLLIALGVLVLELGRPWQWPGPSDLALPAVGCALGVGATAAWLAGRRARRRLLLGLGATLLAAPIVTGLVLLAALEREPLVPKSAAVTSEEKRRLYDLLRDQNPGTPAAGATRSLALDSRDLDLFLAWGLPVVLGEGRGRARVDLPGSGVARVSLTLRFAPPAGRARYLNIVAGARVRVDRGRVSVADPSRPCGGWRRASERSSRPNGVSARCWPPWTASRSAPGARVSSTAAWSSPRTCSPASSGGTARTSRCGLRSGRTSSGYSRPHRACPVASPASGPRCRWPLPTLVSGPRRAHPSSRTGRPSSPWASCSGIGASRASSARSWRSGSGGAPRRWPRPRSAAARTGRSTSS